MTDSTNKTNTEKLDQAKAHIKEALSLFSEFCEIEMPKVVDNIKSSTSEVVSDGANRMRSGINKSIESAEEGLSDLKDFMKRYDASDDDKDKN